MASAIESKKSFPLVEFLCRKALDLPRKGALVRVVSSEKKVQEIVVSHFNNYCCHYSGLDRSYKVFYTREIWGLDPICDAIKLRQNPEFFGGELQISDKSAYSQWALPGRKSQATIEVVANNYFVSLKARYDSVEVALSQALPLPVVQIIQEYIA